MEENLKKKVDRAIKLIQSASKIAAQNGCPEIEVCYSSGKDSDVILELTKMAGVPYRAIYRCTTIDPPYTIKHAQDKGVEVERPKFSFRDVLRKAGIVSRFRRSCCEYLKEYKILDYAILGIRRDESKKRSDMYKEPELCRIYSKKEKTRQYFPILDWTSEDVEEFINVRGIKCHPLYYDKDGKLHAERRLGCLACPMQSQKSRLNDFLKYPNLVKMYINGGRQFLDTHQHSKIHDTFGNVYEWFCMAIFTKSMKEFRERFCGENLFGEKIDCKNFLEDYFNIKFKD